MKRPLILLLGVLATACRSEKKSPSVDSPPVRTKVERLADPSRTVSTGPSLLLKTPRITVFKFGGSSHRTIENAEQAEGILADLRSLPPSSTRDGAIRSVISDLAKVVPGQALVLLEAWDDALISDWLDAAENVALAMGKVNPEDAANFIEKSVPRASQANVWDHFLNEIPPAQRVPFLSRIPEGSAKLRIAANMVLVWAADAPIAFARWLDEFSPGLSPAELITLGNPSWYPQNQDKRVEPRLVAFRAAETREARIVIANEIWKFAEPGDKAGLIPELEQVLPALTKRERESAVATDPAGYATALSNEQIVAASSKDMHELIFCWAQRQPQAAMDWAMEHQRPEAAGALVPLYYLEPKSALAVASKLPPGKERDDAVSTLSQSVAHDGDMAAAKALLPLITDPDFRERIRKEIDHDWD